MERRHGAVGDRRLGVRRDRRADEQGAVLCAIPEIQPAKGQRDKQAHRQAFPQISPDAVSPR